MNAKNGVPVGEGTVSSNVENALFDTGRKASFLRSLFRGSSYGGLRTRERQRFLAVSNRYAVQRWCRKHLKNLRGVAQSGRAPALGAGCRQFESGYPDYRSKGRGLRCITLWLYACGKVVLTVCGCNS